MIKDLQGAQIEVGDTIAYAIQRGDSPVLATYVVLAITPERKIKAQQIAEGGYGNRASDHIATNVSTLAFSRSRAVIIKKWSDE